MKNFINNNTTTTSISLTGKLFIVPNLPAHWRQNALDDNYYFTTEYKEICEMNGIPFTESTYFVQCWLTGGSSENWRDHGYWISDNKYLSISTSYFPTALFEGKREGDTIKVLIPGTVREIGEDRMSQQEVVLANCELQLDQLDYRYRHFGPFEQCFTSLMQKAKEADNAYLYYPPSKSE